MKYISIVILFELFFSVVILPQKGKWQNEEAREKFDQLEKIKLIETLNLDEETTLRFFARRTEHRKQQDEVQFKIQQKIENLDVAFKSGRAVTVEEIKSNINEINNLQLQLEKNQIEFINSLSDIMSYEEIGKLIVFEKQFRNEVRKLLILRKENPR